MDGLRAMVDKLERRIRARDAAAAELRVQQDLVDVAAAALAKAAARWHSSPLVVMDPSLDVTDPVDPAATFPEAEDRTDRPWFPDLPLPRRSMDEDWLADRPKPAEVAAHPLQPGQMDNPPTARPWAQRQDVSEAIAAVRAATATTAPDRVRCPFKPIPGVICPKGRCPAGSDDACTVPAPATTESAPPDADSPPCDLPDVDPDIGQDDRPMPPDPEATAAGLGLDLAPDRGTVEDCAEEHEPQPDMTECFKGLADGLDAIEAARAATDVADPPQPGDEDCVTPQEACLTCKDWACRVGIGYRLDRAIARRSDATVAPEPPAELDVPIEPLPGVPLAGQGRDPPDVSSVHVSITGARCVGCKPGKKCSDCRIGEQNGVPQFPAAPPAAAAAPAPICTACGLSAADDGDGLCKLCRRGRAEGASVRGKVARKRELPPTVDMTIRAALIRAISEAATIPIAGVALVEAVRKIRPTASPNGIQVELAKTSRAGLIQRVDRGFYAPIGWMPKRG
jgi:hypothetical protein